ncbi:hypothetical protein [Paenibacillus sp. L3-i20]|uniref:hypothetical protein n=1 Tax=Paenibacillus sp. L3-i20 TaxID=2905833 RepID=UPI0020BFE548|nr:hypothetical protein [Paenibacillus sp. L3-i20]
MRTNPITISEINSALKAVRRLTVSIVILDDPFNLLTMNKVRNASTANTIRIVSDP